MVYYNFTLRISFYHYFPFYSIPCFVLFCFSFLFYFVFSPICIFILYIFHSTLWCIHDLIRAVTIDVLWCILSYFMALFNCSHHTWNVLIFQILDIEHFLVNTLLPESRILPCLTKKSSIFMRNMISNKILSKYIQVRFSFERFIVKNILLESKFNLNVRFGNNDFIKFSKDIECGCQ